MDLKDAEALAYALMQEFGLSDWKFKFDSSVRRFGACFYRRRTITLSRKLTELNSSKQVEDTIRHEIAHALAGPRNGHNDEWRATAVACGARPERCYNLEVVQPPRKYRGVCPGCSTVIDANRRSMISCKRCSSVFDSRFLFQWSRV